MAGTIVPPAVRRTKVFVETPLTASLNVTPTLAAVGTFVADVAGTRDTTVGGVDLPAGARLMVHYGSANRDDTVFEHAEALDVGRGDVVRHVAFGKGIHVCVGLTLARMELRIALPLLFERLPGMRLLGAERDTIFFARGFRRLDVAWDA